jgi:hypothetical protein
VGAGEEMVLSVLGGGVFLSTGVLSTDLVVNRPDDVAGLLLAPADDADTLGSPPLASGSALTLDGVVLLAEAGRGVASLAAADAGVEGLAAGDAAAGLGVAGFLLADDGLGLSPS